MNYHTEYPVAPGVYMGSVIPDDYVVVKTVLTHVVKKDHETILGTAIALEECEPVVIFEPMMQDMKKHVAYSMPVSEFLKAHRPV